MTRRIFLHDFGGYPFITQLGRELARRGHTVEHAFYARLAAGQDVQRREDDPQSFRFLPITTRQHFDKYSIARRVPTENEYGRLVAGRIRAARPDVVLSANTPLFSQRRIVRAARASRSAFVFWLQDLLGIGIAGELERRLGAVGRRPLGSAVEGLEARLLCESDHIVAISPRFGDVLDRWQVPAERITVFPNWAPLSNPVSAARSSAWARKMGLPPDQPIALYAGTLGRKHDPSLLLDLATELRGAAQVVVVSEGPFIDDLAAAAGKAGLDSLRCLPFQPFERLPEVLASANVLLTLLTLEASAFSVPSKVMTYLVAGRPIAASMPLDNPAAHILQEHEAGLVNDVDDRDGFIASVRSLIDDPLLASSMGARGRAYAEEHFDITAIGERFEHILEQAVHSTR